MRNGVFVAPARRHGVEQSYFLVLVKETSIGPLRPVDGGKKR
jgi:hypothetical protein